MVGECVDNKERVEEIDIGSFVNNGVRYCSRYVKGLKRSIERCVMVFDG